MAIAYITPAKKTVGGIASLANPNEFTDAYDLVSVGTDGAYLARTFDSSNNVVDECKDQKTCLVFLTASASTTITIKAGDSYASCNDLVVELPTASKYYFITLDSAYFKQVNGGKVGSIFIDTDKTVSVGAFEMR